jgi:tetratricopeptide (TPR) repeat protein
MSRLLFMGYVLGVGLLGLTACRDASPEVPAAPLTPPPPPAASAFIADDNVKTVRLLEERLKRDSEDFIAANKLAGYYLQKLRETGDVTYVTLAKKTAQMSLATLPAEQNPGGLGALAQTEYAGHEFTAARDHAKQLTEMDPRKPLGYQILGDALLEIGDYASATAAFQKMEKLAATTTAALPAVEQRFARLDALRGDWEGARRRFTRALQIVLTQPTPSAEIVAWHYWQIGETHFATGDFATAEKRYRDALTAYPSYFRSLAALGRARAAQGDVAEATECYEKVVRMLPDPMFLATLGDLYALAGHQEKAARQYVIVESAAKLNALSGALHNRQLARFYADHDMKAAEAYGMAKAEYAERRDIYGADTLAWTAFKAGKFDEAQAAMKEALRLGTQDATLLYHAGMIACAAGERDLGKSYLEKALKLNPHFDERHAPLARAALESVLEK